MIFIYDFFMDCQDFHLLPVETSSSTQGWSSSAQSWLLQHRTDAARQVGLDQRSSKVLLWGREEVPEFMRGKAKDVSNPGNWLVTLFCSITFNPIIQKNHFLKTFFAVWMVSLKQRKSSFAHLVKLDIQRWSKSGEDLRVWTSPLLREHFQIASSLGRRFWYCTSRAGYPSLSFYPAHAETHRAQGVSVCGVVRPPRESGWIPLALSFYDSHLLPGLSNMHMFPG